MTADGPQRQPAVNADAGFIVHRYPPATQPSDTRRSATVGRFWNYVNTDSIKLGKTGCEIQRIPAGEIETVVVERMRHVLRAPEVLAHAVREVCALRPKIGEADAIRTLQAMNPVDHPHGGRTNGGRHPVTPWGIKTKGKKTRKNKNTDKYIISRKKKRGIN